MKILCKHLIILAVIICCIAGIAISAHAEEVIASGTCGANLTWTLDNEGTLTISGTGSMDNYSSDDWDDWDTVSCPWSNHQVQIKNVKITDGVTSIGGNAFYNCSNLVSITIPDSVTYIGEQAFSSCDNLQSFNIPDGVTSIRNYAFVNCSSLTSITIPDSVTSIGSSVFSGCSSLTSITIPKSVRTIDEYAFRNCSLTGIWVDTENPNYASDNYGVLFNKTKTQLIRAPEGLSECYTIPYSVTSIGYSAFEDCSSLTSITIPNSVRTIDEYAFSYCSNLTSINIPDSVTSIGSHAFSSCSSLTSITIPNRVRTIDEYVFSYCSNLTSITIPDSVTSIGSYAFSGCNSLTSITIPDSVTSIGDYAFSRCSSLTSITIPNSVSTIGERTFSDCSNLTSITIPNSVITIDDYAFENCSSLTSITIPDSVTSIGIWAFRNCSSLTSITIPKRVRTIGSTAFYGCKSLTGIWIDTKNPNYASDNYGVLFNKTKTQLLRVPEGLSECYTIPNSVITIDDYAFENCSSLTSITIPDSVTSIGYSAFKDCSSLTSITIPDSVTSIGNSAFYDCSSLTSVTIPDSVTSIGYFAFEDCSSLTSITIPDSVTSIGSYAFSGCSSLTSVTIPDSVTSIGYGAFVDCSSLSHVAYTGTENQWNSISIGSDNTRLTSATRHYETRFLNVDNCIGKGVYCPVCEEYLEYEPKNGEHNYGDWFITTPPTVTTEGEKEKVCSVCGDRVTETIPMLICGVSYWGISLEDDIGATFYLNLGDYDSENTSVAVQFDNTQRKYDLCDLTTVDGKYVLKVNVAAAQMCDDIIIQVLSDDAVIREMKYTIRQYAEYILNGNYSDEIKHLVQAMLNYGASTQKLFTHNTSNPANLGYEMTDVPEIPEASSNSVAMGTVDGIEYYGASLNCEAKISVKFYFTVTGNIKDYTFTDSKGNTYRAIYRAGMYCVEVPDINPADYDQIIKIIVHDGSSIMMVDYSPLRYISRKFYGSDDSNLVNMVAALYRYHKAAESYLDSL